MKKFNLIIKSILIILATACLFSFCGCELKNKVTDIVSEDAISDRVNFDKKYYYLGYDGYDKNQFYSFSDDGSAIYTHIMQEGESVTFHQIINFKWTYGGEGNCILMHNGTQIVKGEQDDAFGISRVMHVGKDVVYWSADGQNTYYICEDFTEQIPNYAKLISNK